MIRAAAKNFHDVLCISDKEDYTEFLKIFKDSNGSPSLKDRKLFALKASTLPLIMTQRFLTISMKIEIL